MIEGGRYFEEVGTSLVPEFSCLSAATLSYSMLATVGTQSDNGLVVIGLH